MTRLRTFTTLLDSETGEVIAQGCLTPARTKRILKEYARFGYYLEVAGY
jgi:hypothetical protein